MNSESLFDWFEPHLKLKVPSHVDIHIMSRVLTLLAHVGTGICDEGFGLPSFLASRSDGKPTCDTCTVTFSGPNRVVFTVPLEL